MPTTGESVSTVAHAWKKAMRDAARDVVFVAETGVLVSFGHPGMQNSDEVVMFQGLRSEQDPGPLSSSNRARDELLELDVLFSVFKGGGAEAEEASSDRGYQLLGMFENYLRGGTNLAATQLGGIVRECFLIKHESDGFTVEENQRVIGRNVTILATFQAKARIATI